MRTKGASSVNMEEQEAVIPATASTDILAANNNTSPNDNNGGQNPSIQNSSKGQDPVLSHIWEAEGRSMIILASLISTETKAL